MRPNRPLTPFLGGFASHENGGIRAQCLSGALECHLQSPILIELSCSTISSTAIPVPPSLFVFPCGAGIPAPPLSPHSHWYSVRLKLLKSYSSIPLRPTSEKRSFPANSTLKATYSLHSKLPNG